ncbi:phosphoserine phosphatase SerB [Kiloniella antarctica]|uniref:Phosphoserine phosphatase n=1 Tax=Kiloniella antarctica TaxID=1550907 RepID=A0ABW5BD75_9PROT
MRFVATLVAPTASSLLDYATVQTISTCLKAHGATLGAEDWLSDNEACDIFFSELELSVAKDLIHNEIAGAKIDLSVQETSNRRKKLLVADMESTIIPQEMIDELAVRHGIGDEIALITGKSMRGELNFEESLRERVALLKGIEEKELESLSSIMTLNPGADTLVKTMRGHGAYTALVSGGFTYFTSQIKDLCGFDEDRANDLKIENNKLTGMVGEPILGREAKLEVTEALVQQLSITLSDVCAVGDGANDLAMLSAVGMGVGYHAKPIVKETAAFQVEHTNHLALLFYQGYRRKGFY